MPTAQEIANSKKYAWMRPTPYDLVASGTLVLTIEGVWGVRHTWKDGKTQQLEAALNDVIVGLLDAAFQQNARRAVTCRVSSDQSLLENGPFGVS
ncbi:MAG: hypothetical protein WC815_14190 [Vicinamibacterales bacterium]